MGWGFAFIKYSPKLLGFLISKNSNQTTIITNYFDRYLWFYAYFLGLFILMFLVLNLNFISPIHNYFGYLIFILGLFFSFQYRQWFRFRRKNWFCFLVISFLVTAYSVDNNILGDTALYHAPLVVWAKQSKIVLGLGNLHDRFGLNPLYFILSSLFTFTLDPLVYVDLLTASMLSVFLIFLIFRSFEVSKIEDSKSTVTQNSYHQLFFIILFVLICLVWGKEKFFIGLGSPGNDLPAALVFLVMAVLSFDAFFNVHSTTEKNFVFSLQCIFFLLVLAFKVSQAAFVMPLLMAALPLGFVNIVRRWRLILFCIFFVLFWTLRNWLLSGYLLFPAIVTKTNADWVISTNIAEEIRLWVMSWARDDKRPYFEVLKDSSWLLPWLKKHMALWYLNITLFLIALGFFTFLKQKNQALAHSARFFSYMSIGIFLYLSYWFVLAPDIRFAAPAFIFYSSLCAWWAMTNYANYFLKLKKIFSWIFIVVGLVAAQDYLRIAIAPIKISWFWPQRFKEIPDYPVSSEVSNFRVNYFKQVNFPDGSGGCYLHPPPCASLSKSQLKETKLGSYQIFTEVK